MNKNMRELKASDTTLGSWVNIMNIASEIQEYVLLFDTCLRCMPNILNIGRGLLKKTFGLTDSPIEHLFSSISSLSLWFL